MVSNKLTHRRTTISNPKICKSKLKPLRPLPPESPPQWPPPYINARIIALVRGQHFETSVTLEPHSQPPVIYYLFPDYTSGLRVGVYLYATLTPQKIRFSSVAKDSSPPFYAYYGPYVTVQPPTFYIQNSHWDFKDPYDAQITLAIAYPDQP